ncbi:MAG TPA: hypothetical protein DDW18_02780, partial [Firmicutes bacterium]|nr:hypothetical protein [Bacillota bacterium]
LFKISFSVNILFSAIALFNYIEVLSNREDECSSFLKNFPSVRAKQGEVSLFWFLKRYFHLNAIVSRPSALRKKDTRLN